MEPHYPHQSVLLQEVCAILAPQPGESVLDVTLGLGGHAKALAEAVGENGSLLALDADAANLAIARERLSEVKALVTLHQRNFRDLPQLKLPPVHVLLADLGLSSPHIDDPARGFTFRADAPLDMRYDQTRGESAGALLARSSAEELRTIFRSYGELPTAHRLATLLAGGNVSSTGALRSKVEEEYGAWVAKQVLPQLFQALRIAVNGELEALDILLKAGPALLAQGGRMGVISYHSLEDRMVKHVFRALTTPERDELTGRVSVPAAFELLTSKAIVPSEEEIKANPRARSAKFRAIRRIAPPTL